jgi:hypothetical protein
MLMNKRASKATESRANYKGTSAYKIIGIFMKSNGIYSRETILDGRREMVFKD